MPTASKSELYDYGACNGVSLVEQNATVILYPLQPRNGTHEKERVCRKQKSADVSVMNSHKEKLSSVSPSISQLPRIVTNGSLPPPSPGSTRVELESLSFSTQVMVSKEDESAYYQSPGSENRIPTATKLCAFGEVSVWLLENTSSNPNSTSFDLDDLQCGPYPLHPLVYIDAYWEQNRIYPIDSMYILYAKYLFWHLESVQKSWLLLSILVT